MRTHPWDPFRRTADGDEPTLAALLCRDRMLNPDSPQFTDPDTGERACAPISDAYASAWLAWGLDAAAHHANWGV